MSIRTEPRSEEQAAWNADVSRIFILADTDHYVEGLTYIISSGASNAVTACVAPGDGCWEQFTSQHPDILLVSWRAVPIPMRPFFARFREANPAVRILVFGQGMDKAFLKSIMRAGADGYISERMSGEQVLAALQKVRTGELWAEREILSDLVRTSVNLEDMIERIILSKIAALGGKLSRREVDVFQLVLKGLSTREIADELSLSQQSVKLYLGRLFRKFDVHNRAQLLLMAFERVCPVSNMIRLFRITLDKRNLSQGKDPIIPDPLNEKLKLSFSN